MQVYASMKFIPHIICAGICLIGPYVLNGKEKGRTEWTLEYRHSRIPMIFDVQNVNIVFNKQQFACEY